MIFQIKCHILAKHGFWETGWKENLPQIILKWRCFYFSLLLYSNWTNIILKISWNTGNFKIYILTTVAYMTVCSCMFDKDCILILGGRIAGLEKGRNPVQSSFHLHRSYYKVKIPYFFIHLIELLQRNDRRKRIICVSKKLSILLLSKSLNFVPYFRLHIAYADPNQPILGRQVIFHYQ